MARAANASDYEIVEAYLHHLKKNGKEPTNYYLRKETGASYGKIDEVLERYKRHDSLEAFIASENDKTETLKHWLLELVTPVAQDIIKKTDEDIQKHQQASEERLKEKQKQIRSLQDKLSSVRAEVDEIKLQLLEAHSAHDKTQEKLDTALDTLQEKSVELAEVRVELTKTNELLEQKSKALDNTNRNFDHAIKESARQRKSLEGQLQKQTHDSSVEIRRLNECVTAERENTRVAEQAQSQLKNDLDTAQDKHTADEISISKLKEDNSRLNEQIVDMNGKITTATVKLEERDIRVEEYKQQIQELQSERNEHFTALQTTQNQKGLLETEKALLEKDNTRLESEIVELRKQLESQKE